MDFFPYKLNTFNDYFMRHFYLDDPQSFVIGIQTMGPEVTPENESVTPNWLSKIPSTYDFVVIPGARLTAS